MCFDMSTCSIYSEQPFEYAENNLSRELATKHESSKERESSDVTTKCLLSFKALVRECWTYQHSAQTAGRFLNAFQEALSSTNANGAPFLGNDTIFKMAIIIVMLFDRVRNATHPNAHSVLQVVNAVAVNYFLLLVGFVNRRLKTELAAIEARAPSSRSDVATSNDTSETQPRKEKKRIMSRLRRKKKFAFTDNDSDLNFHDSDDSELSEIEETVLSTIDALDISSEESSDEDDASTSQTSGEEDGDDEDSAAASKDTSKQDEMSDARHVFQLSSIAVDSVKILCDWLSMYSQLLECCFQSGNAAFAEFCKLLNNLTVLERKYLTEKQDLSPLLYTGDSWKQDHPLKCDIALRNFTCFKNLHETSIDFGKPPLEHAEADVLYIQSLKNFAHFLSRQYPAFVFNADTNKFELDGQKCVNTENKFNGNKQKRTDRKHPSRRRHVARQELKHAQHAQPAKPAKDANDSPADASHIQRRQGDAMRFTLQYLKVCVLLHFITERVQLILSFRINLNLSLK